MLIPCYTQRCGSRLYDDFIELRHGAAKEFETLLNECGRARSADHSVANTVQRTKQSISNTSSFSSKHTPSESNKIKEDTQSQITKDSPEPNSPAIIDIGPEGRWLLMCAKTSMKPTSLTQLDVCTSGSDHELFQDLKRAYMSLKSRMSRIFSLKAVKSIRFVQVGTDPTISHPKPNLEFTNEIQSSNSTPKTTSTSAKSPTCPRRQERRLHVPTRRPHPARRRAPDDAPLPPPRRRQRPQSHHVPAHAQEAQTEAHRLPAARDQHWVGRAPRRRLGVQARVVARAAAFPRREYRVCGLLGGAGEGFAGCDGREWVCGCFDGACARDGACFCGVIRICSIPSHPPHLPHLASTQHILFPIINPFPSPTTTLSRLPSKKSSNDQFTGVIAELRENTSLLVISGYIYREIYRYKSRHGSRFVDGT